MMRIEPRDLRRGIYSQSRLLGSFMKKKDDAYTTFCCASFELIRSITELRQYISNEIYEIKRKEEENFYLSSYEKELLLLEDILEDQFKRILNLISLVEKF